MGESVKFVRSIKLKLAKFWREYEVKIVLIFAFILVATLSFEVGILKGQKIDQKPLIIEKPMTNQEVTKISAEGQILTPEANQKIVDSAQKCAYVGSKNSNKYHLPSCQWAKRIKPENVICFKSKEDAVAKNYQPDKSCIK